MLGNKFKLFPTYAVIKKGVPGQSTGIALVRLVDVIVHLLSYLFGNKILLNPQ